MAHSWTKQSDEELRAALPERFWRFVSKGDGCWLWTGYKTPLGYGRLSLGTQRLLAHRVSWELQHGDIQKGQCVCHTCDTPACVRPDHLFLGTMRDNMHDMIAKQRQGGRTGACPHPLTEDDVRAIRARAKAGDTGASIARDYGVSHTTTWAIIRGKTWTHVVDLPTSHAPE
jgi:hypothetical protein